MIRHYLLIILRNFRRYKSSFFINLFGLSTGLAAALLIGLWVSDELSMDQFHEKNDRLFVVLRNQVYGEKTDTYSSNSDLLAAAVRAELPEVEYIVPVASGYKGGFLSVGDKNVRAEARFADKDFFNVFSYPLLIGDKNRVLAEKYAIVISDEVARNFFDSEANAIGKSIAWDQSQYADTFVVTGVFRKVKSSSEQFDFLLTNDMFLFKRDIRNQHWGSNGITAYVLLREGVNKDEFNVKLQAFYRKQVEPLWGKDHPGWIGTMFLEKYSDRYLYNRWENGVRAGGRIEYVVLLSIVGGFVLIIACINFMNLSTARASRRLKEVGIKKAIGAERKSLVIQYLSESLLITFLSLLVALLTVYAVLPQFNIIAGKELALRLQPGLVVAALITVLLTGLLSGSYPALYLSGFRPAEVLKGKLKTSLSELWVRRGLVIFQFCISILLIVSVVVVYQQIGFVQNKNLGYQRGGVVTFPIEGGIGKNLDTFIDEAKNVTGVVSATYMQGVMTNFNNSSSGHRWSGQQQGGDRVIFRHSHVGYDFIETMGVQLVAGRDFSQEFGDESKKIILNETAVKAMGLKDPIGQKVDIREKDMEIIGVVKDFHFRSLYEEITPMALLCKKDWISSILVRLEPRTERATLERLDKLVSRYNPGIPFEFTFLDDQYQNLYVAEQRVADLSKYFAAIAIVVSCLGLFGLAAFVAERRVREIGIRKVMGCSEWGIVRLLSAEFTSMVVLAIVLTLPLSYVIAQYWLESFAYRISLQWWFFAGSGAAALLIAWLTVGIQTFRAARVNPVENLRTE